MCSETCSETTFAIALFTMQVRDKGELDSVKPAYTKFGWFPAVDVSGDPGAEDFGTTYNC